MNKKKFDFIVYALIFILVFVAVIYAGKFYTFGKFIMGVEYKTFDIRQNIILPHKENNNNIIIIAEIVKSIK